MNTLSPVIIFVYNRIYELKQTVSNLKKDFLALDTDLIIYSDGAKNTTELDKVLEVREYIRSIQGFKSIKIIESVENLGLANSIIAGVTKEIKKHGKIIVLEDDLIVSPNFLSYMNQALSYYENNKEVLSISGFTLPLKSLVNIEDFYVGRRASSWGWATWADRWLDINWDISSLSKNKFPKAAFNKGGSDMTKMLFDQYDGRIDSWAIRFCYHQFLHKQVTIFPTESKVINIGFNQNATHTKNDTRFNTRLDTTLKTSFNFKDDIKLISKIEKDFASFFSIRMRISMKLKKIINIK